jgi:hypothetical protein
MDGVYYTIAGVIFLMPWGSLGLTLAGYLRGRRARLATAPVLFFRRRRRDDRPTGASSLSAPAGKGRRGGRRRPRHS